MSQEGYRGPQVCKVVGITYRQLDYWARTDLLKPSISDARGSGTQRVYSYSDLLKLKVIKQLLDEGMSLQKARQAIKALEEKGDVSSANLVLNGANSLLTFDEGQLLDVLRGGQGVLNILPLAGVKEELDAAIHSFEDAVAAKAKPAAADAPRRAASGS